MFGRQPFSVAPFCFLAAEEPLAAAQRLQARDRSEPFMQVMDFSGPAFAARDLSGPAFCSTDETRGVP